MRIGKATLVVAGILLASIQAFATGLLFGGMGLWGLQPVFFGFGFHF